MVAKMLAGFAIALSLASPVLAQAPDRALMIEAPWARATPPAARTGAAYFTIVNGGPEPDRLVGASSPAAPVVELHTHVSEGNVARMLQVQAVDIPAAGRVAFAPGGLHVMLVNLPAPLHDGTRFPLTLRFARAGEITIEVPVSRSAPPASSGHRH